MTRWLRRGADTVSSAHKSHGRESRKTAHTKTRKGGALYIFVSEQAGDVDMDVTDVQSGRRYEFCLEEERTVLFATDNEGNILDAYRNVSILTTR